MEKSALFEKYKDIMRRSIPLNIPGIQPDELERALDYSIKKRFKDMDCTVHNSYKNQIANLKLSALTNYILERRPIVTASGTIFKRHHTVPNPLYDFIEMFAETRNKFKKEMLKYVKGSEEYMHNDLLQAVAKIDTNAIYGSIGNSASIFYNLYVAESITGQGRACIATSIMLFESFLANNIKFSSLNEIVVFIDNIRTEYNEWEYNDDYILDRNISKEEVFAKLMLTCGHYWYPNDKEEEIIWEMVCNLDQRELNRIYYKNNLFKFCDNRVVHEALTDCFKSLRCTFIDPNNPPEEIMQPLTKFYSMIKEYVYYHYQAIDKLDRIHTMFREAVLGTDTDSCFVVLDGWFRYCKDVMKNEDIFIKNSGVDCVFRTKKDEFGDRLPLNVVYKPKAKFDMNTILQQDVLVEDSVIDESSKQGFRYSAINIMAYCISQLLLDYLDKYIFACNAEDSERKCLMIMKNEFLFKRMLLNGKKNYAAIQELQEGNVVPRDKSLAITGLPIKKVGVAKSTATVLKDILYHDVLDRDNIDLIHIVSNLDSFANHIRESLLAGEDTYMKPARIKSIDSYKDPEKNQGIKASYVYNKLKTAEEESINLNERNSVLIVKVKLNSKNVDLIKDSFPEVYEHAVTLLNDTTNKFTKSGISSIAVPSGAPIPDWVKPFIDMTTILQDNISPFPLAKCGISTLQNKNIMYSNIINL